MTDKTYTLKEIRAAIRRCNGDNATCIAIEAELTRPQPSFRDTEVIGVKFPSQPMWNYMQFSDGLFRDKAETRHLRLSELPEVVQQLRNFVSHLPKHYDKFLAEEAKKKLKAFDEVIEP